MNQHMDDRCRSLLKSRGIQEWIIDVFPQIGMTNLEKIQSRGRRGSTWETIVVHRPVNMDEAIAEGQVDRARFHIERMSYDEPMTRLDPGSDVLPHAGRISVTTEDFSSCVVQGRRAGEAEKRRTAENRGMQIVQRMRFASYFYTNMHNNIWSADRVSLSISGGVRAPSSMNSEFGRLEAYEQWCYDREYDPWGSREGTGATENSRGVRRGTLSPPAKAGRGETCLEAERRYSRHELLRGIEICQEVPRTHRDPPGLCLLGIKGKGSQVGVRLTTRPSNAAQRSGDRLSRVHRNRRRAGSIQRGQILRRDILVLHIQLKAILRCPTIPS